MASHELGQARNKPTQEIDARESTGGDGNTLPRNPRLERRLLERREHTSRLLPPAGYPRARPRPETHSDLPSEMVGELDEAIVLHP